MARTTKPNTVLVVDDERHSAEWMIDYIEFIGYNTVFCRNLNEYIDVCSQDIFRMTVVDLNIPALPPLDSKISDVGPLYTKYPGLYAARFARNRGYRDRQVVVYSVHQDPEVVEETKRLGCTYLRKGRPRAFQEELRSVLSYDPTE